MRDILGIRTTTPQSQNANNIKLRDEWLDRMAEASKNQTKSIEKKTLKEVPSTTEKSTETSVKAEIKEKKQSTTAKNDTRLYNILGVTQSEVDIDDPLGFFIDKTYDKTPQQAMEYMLSICAKCLMLDVGELERKILNSAYLMISVILSENDVSIFPQEHNSYLEYVPYSEILGHLENGEIQSLTNYTIEKLVEDLKNTGPGKDPFYFLYCLVMFSSSTSGTKVLMSHPLWDRKNNMSIRDTILGSCLSIFNTDSESMKTFEASLGLRRNEETMDTMRSYIQGYIELFDKLTQNLKKANKYFFLKWYVRNVVQDPNYKMRSGMYHQMNWRLRDDLQKQEGFHLCLHMSFMTYCKTFTSKITQPGQLQKFLGSLDDCFFETRKTRYGVTDEPVIDNSEMQSSHKKANLLTRLFFTSHLQMYRGVISCMESYKYLSSLVEDLRQHAHSSRLHEKAYIEAYIRQLSFSCLLFDLKTVRNTIQFVETTCHWLCDLLNRDDHTWKKIPEFIITNVTQYLILIALRSLKRNTYESEFYVSDACILFLIRFLGKSGIKSHHIKNSVLEALLFMACPHLALEGKKVPKYIKPALYTNEEIKKTIIPHIVKFYIDVEISDSPSNYYQKYSSRYKITLILKQLRELPEYKVAIKSFVDDNTLFEVFMRRLISDASYLLDELVEKLPKIRAIEREKSDGSWASQSPEYRAEREQEFAQMEQIVSVSSRLANESVELLHFFSQFDSETLKEQEISNRLSVMLCYFLRCFAGPRRKEMVVGNRHKLNFKPRYILSLLVETFVYFHEKGGAFDDVLIQDNKLEIDIFEEAIIIINSKSVCSPEMALRFESFVDSVKEKQAKNHFIPEDEIPEEFLDPLVFSLMEDPVTLPSGISMDRKNILRHLESNPTDPFNRQPLTSEQLISNEELKIKIEAWRKSKFEELSSEDRSKLGKNI